MGVLKTSIKSFVTIISDRINNISSLQRRALNKWFKDDGDNTLRLDYDLNEDSVVFDLGGYKGEWSKNIYAKYNCKIYIFEPVKAFYEQIKSTFKNNKNIFIYNFGLDKKDSETLINCSEDGSSLFMITKKDNPLAKSETVYLKKASQFFDNNNVEQVDLMKINIEGGEYDLLEHLIEEQLVDRIKNIQVQFHDIPDIDSDKRMRDIQSHLKKTHHLTYQYAPYVWENWERV